MSEQVLSVDGVSRSFGRHEVLQQVSLSVAKGEIFALLGRNGAGKTTLIRMLLGLLPREGGSVKVLGLDPARDALAIRQRVGYLAEDQAMYDWMTVADILRFVAPFYHRWDQSLAQRYVAEFELPTRVKIRHLSKGQSVRLGLVLALAHHPELIILDDPALGLDPILRKEFNRDLVTRLPIDGVAVLYSSHLLYEVEPVADRVAILHRGTIVANSPTEELRANVKRIVVPAEALKSMGGADNVLDISRDGTELAVTCTEAPRMTASLEGAGVPHRVVDLNLDEIFEAYVIGRPTIDDRGSGPSTGRGDLGKVA